MALTERKVSTATSKAPDTATSKAPDTEATCKQTNAKPAAEA